MTDVLEIPVLATEKDQSEEFFLKLSFQALPETGAVKYAEYTVSAKQLIYIYLLGKFSESQDFRAYDRLIPKAAFCWLLYERQDVAFEKTVKAYTERYSTPLICLAPRSAEASLNRDREPIPQWPVLYYDSQSADPLRDALQRSLAKMKEMSDAGIINAKV